MVITMSRRFRLVFQWLKATFIVGCFWASAPALAQDDFCSRDGVPARIYANIPVTTAGNLRDFLTTNDLDRLGSIEGLFAMTPEVAKNAEASLKEVEDYLAFLNKYYGYMLEAASEDIGRLISERLQGELDGLYFQNTTRGRRIYFATHAGPDNASPIGFAAYGTYSFIGEQSISITLKLVRLDDGESRTFVAAGEPIAAIRVLARKIFDAFQFPGAQSVTNPFLKYAWVGGPKDGVATTLRVSEAADYCEALAGRLPTKMEMMLAYSLGPYVSGAKLDASMRYAVTEDDEVKMFLPADGSCLKNRFDQTVQVQVLCLMAK